MPIKIVATASTLSPAISAILCVFPHRTARERAEVTHPSGIRRLVMVVKQIITILYISPLPNAERGGGIIAGFYGISKFISQTNSNTSYHWYYKHLVPDDDITTEMTILPLAGL